MASTSPPSPPHPTSSTAAPLDAVTIDSGSPLTSLAVPPTPSPPLQQSRDQVSSSPVELSDLSGRQQADQSSASQDAEPTTSTNPPASSESAAERLRPVASATRNESEAIGPASDQPTPQPDSTAGPTLMITLLLPSGARHPFKIDAKYLARRSIAVNDGSPMNISVYNMKELIWRDWRSEWEPRPTSPTYIRLIFFGAMLDDKAVLKECKFNLEAPNVVHMSVKPQELAEDEDVKHSKHGRRGSESDRRGLNCCVVL